MHAAAVLDALWALKLHVAEAIPTVRDIFKPAYPGELADLKATALAAAATTGVGAALLYAALGIADADTVAEIAHVAGLAHAVLKAAHAVLAVDGLTGPVTAAVTAVLRAVVAALPIAWLTAIVSTAISAVPLAGVAGLTVVAGAVPTA